MHHRVFEFDKLDIKSMRRGIVVVKRSDIEAKASIVSMTINIEAEVKEFQISRAKERKQLHATLDSMFK